MPRIFRSPHYEPLFSHQVPCAFLLPGTDIVVCISPACMTFQNQENTKTVSFDPAYHFISHTTFLHLLHETVHIEGDTPSGFLRLLLHRLDGVWCITSLKRSVSGSCDEKLFFLNKGESFPLFALQQHSYVSTSRLVLTSPCDMRYEALLYKKRWMSLAEQMYGIDSLLSQEAPRDSLLLDIAHSFDMKKVEQGLIRLLLEGFSGMMVPRIGGQVRKQWGFDFWPYSSPWDNLAFLSATLRSFFLIEDGQTLTLLPRLLPSMHSGQIHQEWCANKDVEISFDWRKGHLRRVLIRPLKDVELCLVMQKSLSCRIRTIPQSYGVNISLANPIFFKKNKRYLLDNFSTC